MTTGKIHFDPDNYIIAKDGETVPGSDREATPARGVHLYRAVHTTRRQPRDDIRRVHDYLQSENSALRRCRVQFGVRPPPGFFLFTMKKS